MRKYSNLNGPIIFMYIVFSLISFCCLFIQINAVSISFQQILLECFGPILHVFLLFRHQLLKTDSYDAIIQYLMCFMVGVGWLFAFCFNGENATEGFKDFADYTYHLDWYAYPLNVQKKLQMMITISQDTMHVEGYFNTRCTRGVFRKVCIFVKIISLNFQ